ncbi:ArsR/SmtB family transcription factor [Methanosarcina lacustris]|nr:metalloregulator ArsR/SmtB family transcription factor [Methanosarcina lacustris]
MINEENIQIFKALSEETRYKIIKVLLEGEKCACEIPDLIGRTQSNTSMHLAKLQDWDIIKVRKDGKKRLYSIDNEKVRKLLKLLEE